MPQAVDPLDVLPLVFRLGHQPLVVRREGGVLPDRAVLVDDEVVLLQLDGTVLPEHEVPVFVTR